MVDMLRVPAAGCDCSSCPFWKGRPADGIPGGAEPVCDGSNPSCSWCSCSVAERTVRSSDRRCGSCPVRCGSRPDMPGRMGDVHGTFTFDDVCLSDGPTVQLPRLVPLADARDMSGLQQTVRWPAWGVPIRRLLTRADTGMSVQSRWLERGAHDVLGLSHGQKAVLVGYGPDGLLERLWDERDRIVGDVAACGFDLVTSPDFSVYADAPRAEQMFNMRRSLLFAEMLDRAGCGTVAPAVYAGRKTDLDRWVEWAADTEPDWLFLPRHTIRLDRDWSQFAAPALAYLAQELSDEVRVLVSGVAQRSRLADLGRWFGRRLHVASQNPVQHASHGRAIVWDGRVEVHGMHDDLVGHNLQTLDSMIGEVIDDEQTV